MENFANAYLNKSKIIKNESVLFSDYSQELFCKRDEQDKILPIFKPLTEWKRCENVFLYGSSGTGKTPLAKYILDKIKELNRSVNCIYINCWYHDTSMAIYTKIADSLGEIVSRRGRASDEIFEKILRTMKYENTPVFLILDEMDGLVSKGEHKILHNISRLENNGIRFGLMGISDNKNILSRLCPRVLDSLRFNYVEMQNYSKEQLIEILYKRAEEGLLSDSYNDSTIEKIAQICFSSGANGRLVLEILRKSAKLAENHGRKQITFSDIDEVAYKILYFKNPKLSREEQIILDILRKGEMKSSELYWLFCKQMVRSKRHIRNYIRKLELKGLVETRELLLEGKPRFKLIKLKNGGW